MSSVDAMGAAYAALAQRAWDSNRSRASELNALLAQWRSLGGLTAEHLERVRSVAHSLRGSAGTFGHDRAADAAEELEELLLTEPAPRLDVVAGLVERVDLALAEAPELEF